MRTTVIPAQITTVEDKIAGNLNLTQILLLLTPLFLATVIYAVLPPGMHLIAYKFPLVVLSFIICLFLAMRIRGKVVLSWVIILSRFALRPKYYVFNKNDVMSREIIFPVLKEEKTKSTQKETVKEELIQPVPNFAFADVVKVEQLVANPNTNMRVMFGKKGGLNVAISQVES